MAPPPAATAGPPVTQGSKPAICIDSLRSGAWARSWDHPKPVRGSPGLPREDGHSPLVNARNKHTESPKGPGGFAHADLRKRPGACNLCRVGGPHRGPPSPRCRSPLLQRPPEPARGPRQRRAPAPLAPLAPGVFGPHFLVSPRSFVRRHRSPAAKAGSPLQRARGARFRLGARRQRMPGSRGRCEPLAWAWLGARWPRSVR